jgi:Ras-related protein Rab-6A
MEYKFKVNIVGDEGVGKTSLISRFVYDVFSDKYIQTIGTNVHKKEVRVGARRVTLMLWDIMGSHEFREVLSQSYFYGASALICVADWTRQQTLESVPEWVRVAEEVVKVRLPKVLLVNKADLRDERAYTAREVAEVAKEIGARYYYFTSAKTGESVEAAFGKMATMLTKD